MKVFEVFPTGSHPMGQLMTMMAALSSFYPEFTKPPEKPGSHQPYYYPLIGKNAHFAAMIQKKGKGHPVLYQK